MTAARLRALLFALVLAGAILFVGLRAGPSPIAERQPAERPALLLLTSLPLLFNEDFSLRGGGSKALTALQSRYRVIPISVASSSELSKGRLLLMAQPLAQTPENLVALDAWVRSGGRLLLLADPLLEWSSKRPLGDPLRPPPMFADTGLLAHWGLRLDAPEERGMKEGQLGGYAMFTVSPGELSGSCAISSDRLVARCRVGKGAATIVADADFLNDNAPGLDAKSNLDGLLAELARLESK